MFLSILVQISGKRFQNALFLVRGMLPLVIMAGLTGCEKDIEIDVPGHTPKLAVLYNLNNISPGQNMYVRRSQSVLSGELLWKTGLVRDASISISDSRGTVVQRFTFVPSSYDPKQGQYQRDRDFTPVPGHQYILTISAPGFETIQGNATIPEVVPVRQASFQPDSKQNRAGILQIQFQDITGQEDYYHVVARTFDEQNNVIGTIETDNDEGEIVGEGVERLELNNEFDDGWANTQGVITLSNKVHLYGATPKYIEVTLEHITRDWYLFLRSRGNYQEDNPFAEPLNLHSNIRNGYGLFGGVTTTKFVIQL